jgi:hypothetical protein
MPNIRPKIACSNPHTISEPLKSTKADLAEESK